MPSGVIPPFPSTLTPANLITVDFNLLLQDDSIEKQKVYEAASTQGFLYLENHAIDPDFMFRLSTEIFALPLDEKMKYDMGKNGGYFGYKSSGSQYVDAKGNPDTSEFFNISKDDILRVSEEPLQYPAPVDKERENLEKFMKSSHKVVTIILRIFGEALGLDPDALPSLHRIDRPGGDQVRVTWAPPNDDPKKISLGEHSDFGSVTVLFNKLGGLQVLNPDDEEWRYVKPKQGCAVINLGDALVKLVGGKLHSGVHRVVSPPGEQGNLPRESVVYFSRPNGDVKLKSLLEETEEKDGGESMTADEWIANRVYHRNIGNFKGKESFLMGRGTEHNMKNMETVA